MLFILVPAVLFMHTGLLSAAWVDGVYFQNSVTLGGEVLEIRGAGLLKWLFFRIYVAALYLPPDVPDWKALGDVPKKMEFHYLSDMKAEQFAESGEPLLEKNASPDELAAIRDKIDSINMMYQDVEAGERYSLTYIPGMGTELSLNGKVLGRIEGYDFAAVYYRIWLGEDPVDDTLKSMLLKNSEEILSAD